MRVSALNAAHRPGLNAAWQASAMPPACSGTSTMLMMASRRRMRSMDGTTSPSASSSEAATQVHSYSRE